MGINIDTYFFQLVTSLKLSALQHLNKLDTKENAEEMDIDKARTSIEMLAMLSEKTFDNATDDEKNLLDEILFDLRRLLSDTIEENKSEN